MLPADPSPSKQRQVKTQRVLEWVTKSDLGASATKAFRKQKLILTPKRKIRHDENQIENNPVAKRMKSDRSSKPLSPHKFYLPNEEEITSNKAFPLPSTPESKRSEAASSLCFSPDKLDGIFIRKMTGSAPTKILTSDSESVDSTPVKQKSHRLTCGLDSPDTDSTFKTPETTTKKFSKLGHRWNGKSALELIKDSIKRDTRKISRSGKREKVAKIVPEVFTARSKQVTETSVEPVGNNQQLDTDYLSDVSTVVSASTPSAVQSKSDNEMDKTNNTLTDAGSGILVQKKLLPLFQRKGPITKDDKGQMLIDAGQKDFDEAKRCAVCRMIYSRGDPDDEALHRQFHSRLIQALKFTGWKKENVAAQGANHKVIYIEHQDPPYCRNKVQALKVILDQELGYVQEVDILKANRRVYMYVSDKQIKGVCIAESIREANRLEGDKAGVRRIPAHIGINRLWVYAKYRREGIATRLLDAIRSTFGLGMCVPRESIAFSDPTSHGKMFAAKYTGTNHFLVYKP